MDVARACARIAGRHLLLGGSAIMQLGTLEQAARISDGLPDVGLVAGRGPDRRARRAAAHRPPLTPTVAC